MPLWHAGVRTCPEPGGGRGKDEAKALVAEEVYVYGTRPEQKAPSANLALKQAVIDKPYVCSRMGKVLIAIRGYRFFAFAGKSLW